MSAAWKFSGLEELKAELRALPETLKNEAGVIAQAHAQTAAAAMRAEYQQHRDTGYLADHVRVEVNTFGRFGVSVTVRNKSPHAWWFENGTQARHYVTTHGVTKLLGKMPATPTFIPIMMRFRRAMYGELSDLLVRHGLAVTGTP